MKISVVMAVYDGKKYFAEQLKSICGQSKCVDEIIIVDDCSNEKIDNILSNITLNSKSHIRYFENRKNIGYAQTFFKALALSEGDYIFFADQDDIWEYKKVELMVSELEKNKDILCLSSLNTIINANGKIMKVEKKYSGGRSRKIRYEEVLNQKCLRPGMSLVIHKKLKEKVISFNLMQLKQHDRFIELIAAVNNGFYILNEPLTRYRIHESNTSGLNLTMRLRSDFEGRICQIDKEVQYLNTIETFFQQAEPISSYIEKLKKFYTRRKEMLFKRLHFYIIWGFFHINKYSNIKILFGDIIAKIEKKRD